MLTLPARSGHDVIAFDDDTSGVVHVAALRPQLRSGSSDDIRLLHWVTPQENEAVRSNGALLTIDLTVAASAEALAAAGIQPDRARPLDMHDSVVEIDVPQLRTITTTTTTGADAVAMVAAELSATEAAVLAPLLEGDTASPIQVRWHGRIRGRLPEVEVSASVDSHELRSRLVGVDGDEIRVVTRSLLTMMAHIEIRGSTNAALEAALREWALDEIARRVEVGENLAIHTSAAEVVWWPILLQGTIDLGGIDRSRVVRQVVLRAEDVAKPRPLEVRVLGDFGGRLERVDLDFRVDGRPAPPLSLIDSLPHRHALGSSSFEWRQRVRTANQTGSWSGWDSSTASALTVAVQTPPRLSIEVAANALDFTTRWRDVVVGLTHVAPGASEVTGSLKLDADRRSDVFTIDLSGPPGTTRAVLTYTSQSGYVAARAIDDVRGNLLIVSDPFSGGLRRTIVPSGSGWQSVAMAMIDLRHESADGPVVDETIPLTGLGDLKRWDIGAAPTDTPLVSWRANVSYLDGRFERTDWTQTDQVVIVVPLVGLPSRTVHILPTRLDSATVAQIAVRLRSGSVDTTLTFTDRRPQQIELPPGPYVVTMTWTMNTGRHQTIDEAESDDDVVVLPRPPDDSE